MAADLSLLISLSISQPTPHCKGSPHPMTISSHRRPSRRLAGLSALCALALFAVACGSDDDSTTNDTDAAPVAGDTTAGGTAAAPADTAASDGTFPISIENSFGTTVIESKPERVVSIGYTDGDFVLALGVTPVGIRDWYGGKPGGLWPWAAESPAAAESIAVLQSEELNLEKIAELEPDVIIAIGSEIEQGEYDTLTQIAPVVAQTDDYVKFGTPWDVAQMTIGRALGMEAEAAAIVDGVKSQIAEVAAAHPDWTGKTTNVVIPATDGTWFAYTDQDNRGRLLTELGFVIPQPIVDLAGDLFYAQGSGEQLSLVDADLLVYNTFVVADREAVEALPLWSSIPAVADGRSVFLDEQLIGAMSFGTTLSIPYALEGLAPQIEAALGG
jgi:iron complex transport system substrate-binding protein